MSTSAFQLQGKGALVIGASNTIGRAAALALAEAGANVAVATTLSTPKETTASNLCLADLRALGRTGFAETINADHADAVEGLVRRTVAELGRLDILVNAHDLPFAKPARDATLTEWQRVLNVNLTGPYLACRAAAGPMLAQGSGRMINVVSLLGERGMANGSAYCAAQGGVLNLSRALALEWARSGITVNVVGAGWTEGASLLENTGAQQQLVRYIPQKRIAQPEEIAAAVVYLASEATGFITGQIIWVDGGMRSRL
jgi:NAD(P)-dependent dehydrogenase (short-subunit alcohol dehydrogenase family)